MIGKRSEKFSLSAQTIDRISAICVQTLGDVDTDKKDIARIRLSLEEILGIWLKTMEGASVCVDCGQKFGRAFLEVSVAGDRADAWDEDEALLFSNRLLAQAGLSLVYTYKNGKNCLSCNPVRKSHMGQMTQLVIAVILAVVLGLAARFLPQEGQSAALEVTQPLFNMILGGLRAVSSPLVFLAVCCGIFSIGDLTMVGKIGKKLILRMIGETFILSVVMAFIGSLLFPVVTETSSEISGNFSVVYQMVLGIVPSDIVSPFLEGNALQIVFLGVCMGAALLVLGERVASVQNIAMQANEIMQFMMGVIGKMVPLFMFLSIFNLLLSDVDSGFWSLLKVFVIAIPGCFLLTLLYIFAGAVRLSVSPVLLIKKLLPTYLIALTTASSAAALTTNLETCEKQLGIPKKVSDFAIPLGQVIYKPGFMVGFFPIVLCMAEYYGVSITPRFLVMSVLTIWLLAMATPPIPGGALSVFTILFAQLGIPSGAIALAVAVNSILDFFMTSVGLACLQVQVTLAAGNMDMLDWKKLRRSPEL
ncbi:MAG: cation:dicarboxylase symporter family transporter [Lachnospiraceae bacterium]|nr:cation:dicarboxylase symporter family transporter [Lachnospiraceae bacterium]